MAANKTAELVKQWADFEQTHPEAEIEDFCRYHLISNREKQGADGFLGGNVPPGRDQTLLKLMGRLITMFSVFAEHGLMEAGVEQFTEFTFLNAIQNMKMPKKTEVINENFMELSSGLLMIDRMKKKGWVIEHPDKTDKRSKRLELSPAGIEVLYNCYMKLEILCAAFFKGLPSDDINLCIQLLKPIETNHSRNWAKNKASGFKEMLEGVNK
jgi:DNA-binding MarR family transcriptional regulator